MTSAPPHRHSSSALARGITLGVALLLVLLAALSVLPAWSMLVLPLVLVSRELSPILALLALLWIPVARLTLGRLRPGALLPTVTLALFGVALVLAWPMAQVRGVAKRATQQLEASGAAAGTTSASLAALPDASDVREQVVRYAAADGSPLSMRVYRAPGDDRGAHAIVVVIYGGAWRGGEPAQGARTSRALAQHGYLVVAIDYRHAPAFIHPAQLEDVRRSLALVRDSAAAWHGDPSRIALLGRSAGGHLAELAAFAPDEHPVQAVVGIYAPWNLVQGYRDVPRPDPIGVRTVIGDFVGGTPDAKPASYAGASPSSYVRPGLPPALLIYGTHDHLVKPEFNRAAAAALRTAGDRVVEVEIPWAEHGFDLVPAGLGERVVYWATAAFLDRVLAH